MKLKLSIFFLILSSIIVAQQKFVLNGVCSKNTNSKNIYLTYTINGKRITKSAIIYNNKFVFKGEIDSPIKAIICTNPDFYTTNLNSKMFYLEPSVLNATLDFDDLSTMVLNGSKANKEFYALQNAKEIQKIHQGIDTVRKVSRLYYDKMSATNDNSLKKQFQKSLDSLDAQLNQLVDQNIRIGKQLKFDFIKKNPNSFIVPDLLFPMLAEEDEQFPFDTIKKLYSKLTPDIKKSYGGKQLAKKIIDFENTRIGKPAPDFNGKDLNSNLLQLSKFRNNKYVLLDFWASWCGPCKEDFPFLKEIYETYNEKGFEIISISKDKNKGAWQEAIKENKIQMWKHLLAEDQIVSIENLYVVQAIPVKILINRQGIIIARWIGSGIDNTNELKKMLEKI